METTPATSPPKMPKRPKGRPSKETNTEEVKRAKPFPEAPRSTIKNGTVPPEKFWAYRLQLPDEFLPRLSFYVYREWPKTDVYRNFTAQELADIKSGRRKKPIKYIGQYPDIDPNDWRNQLLRYHGSGVYKVMLNDAGVRGNKELQRGNICSTLIELRDSEFMPIIEDLSILDLDDPANNSYINELRMKGVTIPGDITLPREEPEEDMANTIAVETLAKLAEQGRQPTVDNSSALLQDMMRQQEARHAREVEEFRKRLEIAEAKPVPHDDLATTRAVIEMARSVIPAPAPPPPQDNKMVEILMQMLKQNEERALQHEKLEAERHARDLDMLNKRLEAQEARAAALEAARLAQATQPQGKSAIQDALSLVKALRGATEEINGGDAGSGNPWVDLATELGPRVLDTAATIANAFKGTPAAAPTQQQTSAPSVPSIQQAPQQQSGDPQMNMMLNMMKAPILNSLKNGVPGHVFAAQMVAQYGEPAYRAATEKGEAGLLQILQSDSQFWGQLLQIGAGPVQNFVTAFLNEQAVSEALQAMAAQQQQRPMTPPPAGRPANQPRPATVVDATPQTGGRKIFTGDGTAVQTKANGVPATEGAA